MNAFLDSHKSEDRQTRDSHKFWSAMIAIMLGNTLYSLKVANFLQNEVLGNFSHFYKKIRGRVMLVQQNRLSKQLKSNEASELTRRA